MIHSSYQIKTVLLPEALCYHSASSLSLHSTTASFAFITAPCCSVYLSVLLMLIMNPSESESESESAVILSAFENPT